MMLCDKGQEAAAQLGPAWQPPVDIPSTCHCALPVSPALPAFGLQLQWATPVRKLPA